MPQTRFDLRRLLGVLSDAGVEFVIVGGVAGTLHGSPLVTGDLDIVPARDDGNIRRLLTALDGLGAYYREQGGRRLRPSASHLASDGHQLLRTAAGRLDVLGTVSGRDFDSLAPHSVSMDLGGMTVRVVDLETLIELKRAAGRPKDQVAVMTLEAIRKLR